MNAKHWQTGDVQANGIRIHYTRTGGDLPPLILAHGYTDIGLCWTAVAQALQAEYDVIMPDARCHGLSDAPDTPIDLATRANDTAGLIAALGLKKPFVLGHSMGAITTLLLAALHPELPGAIVAEDPPDWWQPRTPQPNGFVEWITSIKTKTREQLIADERAASGWSDIELEPWADSKIQLHLNALNFVKPEAISADWAALLPHITCPTLALAADPAKNPALPPDGIAALRGYVPHLEAVTIANAGHSIHRDQFAAFIETVRTFLARYR